MSEEQIKHMVERFLRWRLPDNFNPDAGISFKKEFNENTPWPMKHEPTGTNLFDYTQTEAMVRFMLEGMPAKPTQAMTKEWCMKMAKLEGDTEVGAGSPDHPLRQFTQPPLPEASGDVELREALKREQQLHEFIDNPPKHKFWGAGEPDCPKDIKAGNGELHTLRCKRCGIDGPRDDICRAGLRESNEGPILGQIAEMMNRHVDNWPNPKRIKTAIALINKTITAALSRPEAGGKEAAGEGEDDPAPQLAQIVRDHGYWQAEIVLGTDGGYDVTLRTREGYLVLQSLPARPGVSNCPVEYATVRDGGDE